MICGDSCSSTYDTRGVEDFQLDFPEHLHSVAVRCPLIESSLSWAPRGSRENESDGWSGYLGGPLHGVPYRGPPPGLYTFYSTPRIKRSFLLTGFNTCLCSTIVFYWCFMCFDPCTNLQTPPKDHRRTSITCPQNLPNPPNATKRHPRLTNWFIFCKAAVGFFSIWLLYNVGISLRFLWACVWCTAACVGVGSFRIVST